MMQNLVDLKKPSWQATVPAWLFVLGALEGLLALGWIVLSPSEAGSARWLGLSMTRLVMAGAALLAGLGCAAAAWVLYGKESRLEHVRSVLNGWILDRKGLFPLVTALAAAVLAGLGALILDTTFTDDNKEFYLHIVGANYPVLKALLTRGLPLIVQGTALAVQGLIWLAVSYPSVVFDRARLTARAILRVLAVALTAVLTLVHWTILVFRWDVFLSIPGWYWKFNDKPVTARLLVFAALLAALWLGVRWITNHPRAVKRNLVILLALAYAAQLSIGIADGKGIESLREKYLASAHDSYINRAGLRDESVLDSIRRYEEIYSQPFFTSTKPPGVMAFYIALERTVNTFGQQKTPGARIEQLSKVVAFLMPVLSLLGVWMVFQFGRRQALGSDASTPPDEPTAYLGALLFLLAPNIVLLTLFLDQALYPSLFLGAVMLIFTALRRRSYVLTFGMGCALYAAVFMTFSMLPLFALTAVAAVLLIWTERTRRTFAQMVGFGLSAVLGTGLMFVFFRAALNYEFFARFNKAMYTVYTVDYYLRVGLTPEQQVTIWQRVKQIIGAGFLNNIELAALVSLPVFVLFALRGIKATAAVVRRMAAPGEIVQASLFLTYLLQNAYGQVRGEAGRLWMFWVPMMAIFAAIEAAPMIRRRPWLVYVLLVVQFITLVLTYQFQDLIV